MVDFAGWALPVSYPDLSHVESHLHTRKVCTIFPVVSFEIVFHLDVGALHQPPTRTFDKIYNLQGVSIFDVSHMLQLHIHGKDRIKFIESILGK